MKKTLKDINVTKIAIHSMILVTSLIIMTKGYKIWDIAM